MEVKVNAHRRLAVIHSHTPPSLRDGDIREIQKPNLNVAPPLFFFLGGWTVDEPVVVSWTVYDGEKPDTADVRSRKDDDEGDWTFTGHRVTENGEQYQVRRLLYRRENGKLTGDYILDDAAALRYRDNGWQTLDECREYTLDVDVLLAEWEQGSVFFAFSPPPALRIRIKSFFLWHRARSGTCGSRRPVSSPFHHTSCIFS